MKHGRDYGSRHEPDGPHRGTAVPSGPEVVVLPAVQHHHVSGGHRHHPAVAAGRVHLLPGQYGGGQCGSGQQDQGAGRRRRERGRQQRPGGGRDRVHDRSQGLGRGTHIWSDHDGEDSGECMAF